jgi:phosphoribosyl-ATP pyrophosphohydrolase/phosphoribosyl-AMP cyclohydrolase
MNENNPNFLTPESLLPAIVQHAVTQEVLMLGYMNLEAYQLTVASKRVTFFSRSKGRLWIKGETSGNYLNLVSHSVDCDNDAILFKAIPDGPTCHTGFDTCFGKKLGEGVVFLAELDRVIADRQSSPKKDSYTSALFDAGIDRLTQKVGEEAIEVVIEAKNSDDSRLLSESADLLFHLMVLLRSRGLSINDVAEVLREKRGSNREIVMVDRL